MTAQDFEPIAYRQEGLVVDLAVGLWAIPLPMDYDDDGDLDLLVSTSNKTSPGIYFFENPGGAEGSYPVFRPGRRVGDASSNVTISYPLGYPAVLSPGRRHPDFLASGLTRGAPIGFEPAFHTGRANQWSFVDYDGDAVEDLIIGASDWREYGWDDAYDENGVWQQGPLHGHVYVMLNSGAPEQPRYTEPERIMAGDAPLDVYGAPSPNFADWDGDGDLDLICGEFLDKFTYFENVGSRREPRYAEGRRLRNRAGEITMDLEMLRVVAVDWSGDGDTDLIVGQEDGRVALIEATGAMFEGAPEFAAPRFFRAGADLLQCGVLPTPVSCDWDGDGDEDLISGDTAGYISWIENLDGGDPPSFAAPRRLKAGGEIIRVQAGTSGSIQGPAEAKWGYTAPSVGDWDGDGLPDILINSIWGKIEWFRNVGTRAEPRLEAARAVEVEWDGAPPKPSWNWWDPEGKALVTQWRTTPLVRDHNQDGLNDLVMLDHEGYLAFFERERREGELVLLPGRRIFKDESGAPLRMNNRTAGGSGRRKFVMADWDGDGRIDILANGVNIDFLRNIGDGSEWRFKNEGPLGERVLAGHTTSPTVVDWDGDGTPDLLAGAEDGLFYFLRNGRQ